MAKGYQENVTAQGRGHFWLRSIFYSKAGQDYLLNLWLKHPVSDCPEIW